MLLKKLFIILSLFILYDEIVGQVTGKFGVSNTSFITSSPEMPLWMWANRDGKIMKENTLLNLTELNGSGKYFFNDSNSFINTGATLLGGIGNNKNYFQGNELFAEINLNNWELNAGWYYKEEMFGGLSTTNGNIAQSRNSRPHPRVGIRVSEYKPIPLIGKYFFFKGEYEEGWLNDDRYVNQTHLHHKSLYIKLQPVTSLYLSLGLEHFVMWGGTSSNGNIGELPGWDAYFQYILGKSGDESFLPSEQHNIAGNQYGTYQFLIAKQFNKYNLSLYISHPFDDLSGMNLRNWPDNLIGFYIKFEDSNNFITHILYEFVNTRNQGIDSLYRWSEQFQKWQRLEPDNYFNNHIYKSGVTYQKMALGSPLFFPIIINENISKGFESNRFFAHHIGLKGILYNDFHWKGMLSFIQHLGTWLKPYEQKKIQTSGYFEFFYHGDKFPLNAGVVLAGDIINVEKDKIGFQLTLSKNW